MNFTSVKLGKLCLASKSIFFIFILVFFINPNSSSAQGTITPPVDSTRQLVICSSNTIEFEITGVSGSVIFDLIIPTDLEVLSVQNGTLINNTTSSWSVPVSNGQANLILDVLPACDFFNSSNPVISGTINNVQLSRTFEIIKGDLTYIGKSYAPNNGVVDLYEEVTRCFDYQNTADVPFSGNVLFIDSLERANRGSWIQFLDVQVGNSSGASTTVIKRIVSDSSVIYHLQVENLPPDSVLTICDKVKLIKCTPTGANVFDRSRTLYSLHYGCFNDTSTCVQTPIGTRETLTKRVNVKPKINFRRISPTRTCQAMEDRHIYQIWNQGTGNASGIDFLYNAQLNNTTPFDLSSYDLDSADIELYYLDANQNKIYLGHSTRPFSGTVSPYRCGHCTMITSDDFAIAPGDTLYLEFTERQKCNLDETYFNQKITMQNEGFLAILRHDCEPSGVAFHNRVDPRYPYLQRFSLNQNMPNLVATMTDQQELWFEAKNLNQLWIGSPNYTYPIYYFDKNTFRLEVDLKLTPGLCFESLDSIFLFGNNTNQFLQPESVRLIEIDSMLPTCTDSLCAGARVRLRFQLPNNFFTTKTHPHLGLVNVLSQDYFAFFSNFEVKFLVKGECDCSTGTGDSKVTQEFYAIYDNTCAPDCRIPISSTGDNIVLNCPGCFLPGWNLEAMGLYRDNIDKADNDDNHYPDSYPMQTADPQLVRTDRIMIGDTLIIHVEAFTSDGDITRGGFNFQQAGFDYTYGQFSLESTLVPHLKIIGIDGKFEDRNFTESFSIPAAYLAGANTKIKQVGSSIFLMLDASDWNDILSNNTFVKYNKEQSLELDFKFKVVGNLIDGDGIPPYMGKYELAGRYHMSGTDFSDTIQDGNPNGSFKADALGGFPQNPSFGLPNVNSIQALSGPDRAKLFYWCTHWESRITGVGLERGFGGSSFRGYYQNVCLKKLNMGFKGVTGQTRSDYDNNVYPSALDAFPFELRNIWMLDSFTFEVPRGYRIENIFLKNGQVWKNGNRSQKTPFYAQWFNKVFPNNFITRNNNSITLQLSDFLDKTSTTPLNLTGAGAFTRPAYDSLRVFYGENKWASVNIELLPIDCQENPVGKDTVKMSAFVRNDPFYEYGAHEYSKDVEINLRRGTPIFDVEVTNKQIGLNGVDLRFDLKIVANNIGHDFTPNSFVTFTSTTSGIDITNANWKGTTNVVTNYNTSTNETIYRLGNMSSVRNVKNVSISANYDCSQVNGLDSIMILVGYGCDGYVADLTDACQIDTFYVEIPYNAPSLNATHLLTASNSTCDTSDYEIVFDATGSVGVEQVKTSINLPQGASLASSTGTLIFANQSYNVTTISTSNPYIFEMSPLDSNFIGTDTNRTNAVFNVPLLFSCDYGGGVITTEVTSTDFCGKSLDTISLVSAIANNLNKIDYSKVILSNLTFEIITTCEEATNFMIDVENTNNTASGDFQIEYYCTQDGNGAISPNCLIGSSAIINLSANAPQTITTSLVSSCADCREIKAVLKPLETCICEPNTQVLTTAINCDPCEVNADFTYVITEDCELVITNKSLSASGNLQYNWIITDIDGQLMTTSTSINPTFSYLTSSDFEICLIVEDGTCKDTLCKTVMMCCVDNLPCTLDGSISVLHDVDICEYTFQAAVNVSGNMAYTWQVVEPDGTVYNFNGTGGNLVYSPNVSGLHQIYVFAEWLKNGEPCRDTLSLNFDLETCEPDCIFDGKIEIDDKGDCTHVLYAASALNVTNYDWTVIAPNGSNVTANNASGNSFSFEPQLSGVYKANLIVTWLVDSFECKDTLDYEVCLEACQKPCQYDGEIEVDFDEKECLFSFTLSNSSILSTANITWKVIDPNNNALNIQTTSNATSIQFTPQITGLYQIEVTIEWTDGDEKCVKTLKLNRNLGACKEPCDYDGNIEIKTNACEYEVYATNTSANFQYDWKITDSSGSLINSGSQTTLAFTVPTDGFYSIWLKITWKENGIECSKELSLEKCLEACKR